MLGRVSASSSSVVLVSAVTNEMCLPLAFPSVGFTSSV